MSLGTQLDLNLDLLKTMPAEQLAELAKLLEPKMNKFIIHIPTAKQAAFMNLDIKEAFYGGAAGGGKSDCLLMDALQYVDQVGYSAILFRKTFSDLVKPGALIDRAKDWLAPFLQTGEVHWSDKERKFTFRAQDSRGKWTIKVSTLQFGYLDSEMDRYNYQGGEYHFIGFDELTHFSEPNYKYLFSRARKLKGSPVPLKIRSASNPPDDGQGIWVYNRFVNEETKKPHVVFLPAGLDDNPFVDKESYLEMLDELDPVTRARLKDGVWTIKRSGNLFKRDWFEEVDILPSGRRKIRFWDIASTEKNKKNDPDYTAGTLMSEYQGIFYIEDICAFRGRPEEVDRQQKQCLQTDGSIPIREEQEPGSSGVAIIEKKGKTTFYGRDFKGLKASGSKVDRANPMSAAAERGQVKYKKGCRNIELFFEQAETFPSEGWGIHNDLVDSTGGAFNFLGALPPVNAPIAMDSAQGSYWSESGWGDSTWGGWRP